MISDFFVTTITVTTPSNSIFDEAAVTPSFSPTRQPADTGVLKVSLSNAGSAGSVTVAGYNAAVPVSEEFTISGSGDHYDNGSSLFSSITTISVVGILTGNIEIESFYQSGEPVTQEILVDEFMGRTQRKPEHKAGYLYLAKFGEKVVGDYDLMMEQNSLVKEDQYVYDGNNKYKLGFIPLIIDPFNHWVADMFLVERNATRPSF